MMSQPFSADGHTLYYLVRQGARFTGADQRSGALWSADVETGHRTPLFPGFNVIGFDVSRDGKRIVCAALDNTGAPHLWLARLDRQLSPRQLSPVEADSPRFGAHDDVFFRMRDGAARFIFRIGEDGGEIQKAIAEPILFFMSISPDGAWLVARVAAELHAGSGIVAFSAGRESARSVCAECEADWPPGGRSFVLRSFGSGRPRSLVIALAPGETLPRLPDGGLRSEADEAGLHVAASDGNRYPGLESSRYAYMKTPIQRNIYRVPLP